MIPNHLSLVTQRPEQHAAIQAKVLVDERRAAGRYVAELAYARAYFKILTGKSRVCNRDLWRVGVYGRNEKDRFGSVKDIERAIDQLIGSEGYNCPLPLNWDMRDLLYPALVYRGREREEKRWEQKWHKQQRQLDKKVALDALRHQNLIARIVSDLNFHSPATVEQWYARWETELDECCIDEQFWRWIERFPSLRGLRWMRMEGHSVSRMICEIDHCVNETAPVLHAIEALFVPNKLAMTQEAYGV